MLRDTIEMKTINLIVITFSCKYVNKIFMKKIVFDYEQLKVNL